MAEKIALDGFPPHGKLRDGMMILIPRGLGILVRLEPELTGDDPEAVHDMRVISRRVRSLMQVSAEEFPVDEFPRLFKRVRKVTSVLGQVRNYEVAIRFFSKYSKRARAAAGRESAAWIIERLSELEAAERVDAVRRIGRMKLDHPRRGLVAQWYEMMNRLDSGAGEAVGSGATFRGRALKIIPRLMDDVDQYNDAVLDPSLVEMLHRKRIAVKKLRYSIESLLPAFSDAIRSPYDALSDYQELLGDIHDRDIYVELAADYEDRLRRKGRSGQLLPGFELLQRDLAAERAELFREFSGRYMELGGDELRNRIMASLV